MPIDKYFTELMQWFGVPCSNLSYVLPNIANFYNVNSDAAHRL